MKHFMISLLISLAPQLASAGPGGGGGGIGTSPTMMSSLRNLDFAGFEEVGGIIGNYNETINNSTLMVSENNPSLIHLDENRVEALMTSEGEYARLDDIREEFVHFNGVHINRKRDILILANDPRLQVEKIILLDGKEISIEKYSKKRK